MPKLKSLLMAAAVFAAPLLPQAVRAEEPASMRLEWIVQGQFAGPLIALDKGYYKAAGVDMKLEPGSDDIKPAVMVAQGSDTFGIGHPNQIISARANGVPLVMVVQFGQKSATTYIARKSTGIKTMADLPGHSVGLWFGGDEQEFMAMLHNAGVDPSKVKIIAQGDDISAWLANKYDVMEVTRYNELLEVYQQGYSKDNLVFLNPEDYHAALVNTGIFTTEKEIKEHPAVVQAVVDATLRGWKEALENPEEAAEIVVKYNPELKVPDQVAQIEAMGDMFCAGPTLKGEFGLSTAEEWQTSQQVLLSAKVLDHGIDLSKGYTNMFWDKAPAADKQIKCGA